MDNSAMIKGRFFRWQLAKNKLNFINRCFARGETVYICTATKAIKFTSKHAAMFKATKTGLYMQSGKKWLCISFASIKNA